jgi:hypothetical protein
MNTYRLAILWAFFLAACNHVVGAAPEQACISEGENAWIKIQHAKSASFKIPGRSDICSGGFELIEETGKPTTYMLAAPIELGLRAQRQVFRLDHASGGSTLIGELPASAQSSSHLHFIDAFQQGGSVFQDRYSIDSLGVNRDPTTLELVFDGKVCTNSRGDVYQLELSDRKDCGKLVEATRSKPLCLSHSNGATLVLPLTDCRDLKAIVE